jgi:hypothetical protein
MNSIFNDLLTCQQCKQPFTSTPIVTSCCNATVCESHFEMQLRSQRASKSHKRKLLKCSLCKFDHEISKKFAPNTTVEKLLEMKLKDGKEKIIFTYEKFYLISYLQLPQLGV